jgi:serine/threonine-protein kinase
MTRWCNASRRFGEPWRSTPSKPVNPEAYQEYILGRHLFEKFTWDGVNRGVEHLQRAVSLDPELALAQATLAEAYVVLISWGVVPPKETLAKAEAAGRKAVSLDDSLAEAHTGLGGVHVMRTEWADAEREFQRAISLNPNYYIGRDWHGYLLEALGNFQGALADESFAAEVDPLSEFSHKSVGGVYLLMGRYDDSIREELKALELSPEFGVAHWILGSAYAAKRMYPEAIEEFRKNGGMPSLAYVLAVSGKKTEAKKILDEIERQAKTGYVAYSDLALVHLALGENQKAIMELEMADRAGEPFDHMNVDHRFDALRSDPRFVALLRAHGFTQ